MPAFWSGLALLAASSVRTATARSFGLPRGAAPEDITLYTRSDGTFVCRSDVAKAVEHRQFPASVINDDFCDCPEDGSDEPGTGACARGRFYCENAGSVPQFVRSGLLNDGVCDCCDGSDEWADGLPTANCTPGACAAEAALITSRLASILSVEREGGLLRTEFEDALDPYIDGLRSNASSIEVAAEPWRRAFVSAQKKLKSVGERVQKERAGKKEPTPAELNNTAGRTTFYCYFTEQAAKVNERTNTTFVANVSCLEAQECHYVCALYCKDSRVFTRTCSVNGTGEEISFEPDHARYDEYYARSGHPTLEQLAIDHLLPQAGASAAEARLVETKQQMYRAHREWAPLREEQTQYMRTIEDLEKLRTANAAGFYTLQGQCLNITQEQYVGTTAVREQWHVFHYDLCFFQYVLQHEVKRAPDAAAVWDESGATSAPAAEEAPEQVLLGRPYGFAVDVEAAQLGIEEPLFFTPSQYTYLFAGGGHCSGGSAHGVDRAVAVQFTCGLNVALLRVKEVRMCAYVAEATHPGACDLRKWPPSLQSLADDSRDLEASIQGWLQANLHELRVEDGPLDWAAALATSNSARELLHRQVGKGPGPALPTLAGCSRHTQTCTVPDEGAAATPA